MLNTLIHFKKHCPWTRQYSVSYRQPQREREHNGMKKVLHGQSEMAASATFLQWKACQFCICSLVYCVLGIKYLASNLFSSPHFPLSRLIHASLHPLFSYFSFPLSLSSPVLLSFLLFSHLSFPVHFSFLFFFHLFFPVLFSFPLFSFFSNFFSFIISPPLFYLSALALYPLSGRLGLADLQYSSAQLFAIQIEDCRICFNVQAVGGVLSYTLYMYLKVT